MGIEALRRLLHGCSIVGLDTATFIYHFEDNLDFAPLTQVVFDDVEPGRLRAVASTVSVAEVLTGAKKAGNEVLVLSYRALFASFPNLEVVPVDMGIAEKASDLRSRYGLKMPDAIVVATAIVHDADVLVTNDRGLQRVSEIKTVTLADYVGE